MRRYLIIAGIALVALVVIGGGVLLLVDRNPSLQNAIEKQANLNTNRSVNVNANTNTAPVVKPDPDRPLILFVSRNFTEQYGSATSDDGYQGIIRSADWTTPSLRVQLQAFVTTQRNSQSAIYRATSTQALVLTVTRQTATVANVNVQTQRQETIGQDIQTYNQTISLGLIKQGTEWKVDSAVWQPRS